ncbi:unnamed protein product [Ranitomeya imitator]|uniref:Mitochondrial assembly of ribosomal large subunit protein 1 n=1 Tax=Ranitomeya imitator TaxID=111125 RepID=A0ABN9MHF0_9NEOB|nr:unnamed protein product [Ranitomeya imitator]
MNPQVPTRDEPDAQMTSCQPWVTKSRSGDTGRLEIHSLPVASRRTGDPGIHPLISSPNRPGYSEQSQIGVCALQCALERDEDLPEFNIKVLVNLLRQENGKDLCVIRVPPEMKYVDYFVVVGGTSTRHLQAMAQYIVKMVKTLSAVNAATERLLSLYKFLKGENEPHVCLEGKDTDDWMCIDFGTMVVHFMLPETRETYELEKLWTLRSFDDQLSEIPEEILPKDFTFGLHEHKE